jgi:hypothetical protein
MSAKTRKLQKQILERNNQRENIVKENDKFLAKFDEETNKLQKRLDMSLMMDKPQIKAAQLYCSLSNAIIRKFKPMSEEDATKAYRQLLKLEDVMLASGLFTEEELHE